MPYINDAILSALSDPTRRKIVERIGTKGLPVGEIASRLPVSRPAVSQHLKVLNEAGLVVVATDGTRRIYSLKPEGIAALRDWCDRLWTEALGAFERAAKEIAADEKGTPE